MMSAEFGKTAVLDQATFDPPTGGGHIPFTINGKPVYDLSNPQEIKYATLVDGYKYHVEDKGDWWIVTHAFKNEQS